MQKRIAFKSICIFEDERFSNFFPLSLDRPVFEIDIGSSNIRKRIIDESGAEKVSLLCRPYLAGTLLKLLDDTIEGIEFHVRHVAGLMRMSFEEIFTMFKAIFIKNLKISTRRARGH